MAIREPKVGEVWTYGNSVGSAAIILAVVPEGVMFKNNTGLLYSLTLSYFTEHYNPPAPPKRYGYLNVYPQTSQIESCSCWKSRDMADTYAGKDRIGRIKVELKERVWDE